jgi:hypothetical protein
MEDLRLHLRGLVSAILRHVPRKTERRDNAMQRITTDADPGIRNEPPELEQISTQIELATASLRPAGKPLSIFISHAWINSQEYTSFVHCLNSLIGENGWINNSIPESEAVDFMAEEAARKNFAEEAKRGTEEPGRRAHLEEKLIRARSHLRDHNLPDVLSRAKIYRDGSYQEMDTRNSVLERIEKLEYEISRLAYVPDFLPNGQQLRYIIDDYKKKRNLYLNDSKYPGISIPINRYPELSTAIRKRIECSNIVFVIVSKDLYKDEYLRGWVQFELNMAYELGLVTVSILFDGVNQSNLEYTLTGYRSNTIIEFNNPLRDWEIGRLVAKYVDEPLP